MSILSSIDHAADRIAEALTLHDLAYAARMPLNTLSRHFHKQCGLSPMRWLWRFRTRLAVALILQDPRRPLAEVAHACGFGSSAHFTRRFTAELGQKPSAFRSLARRGEADQLVPLARAEEQAFARALARLVLH